MKLDIMSEIIQSFEDISNATPLIFNYDGICYTIPQISAYDFEKFSTIIYRCFGIMINGNHNIEYIRKAFNLLFDKDIDNYKNWDLILDFLSKVIKPMNKLKYYKYLIKKNIECGFDKNKNFFTLKGLLKKQLWATDLIILLERYYVYCSEVKKKIITSYQKGLGNEYIETATSSQKNESSENNSILGSIHEAVILRLKSRQSTKNTDTKNK